PYPIISIEDYRQQELDQHNFLPKKHRVPPLTLNSELNDIAQKYAEKLAATEILQHSGSEFHGDPMGENIYRIGSSSHLLYHNGGVAAASWYKEIQHYNYSDPGFKFGIRHFTQLVWKDTTTLGVGRALSKKFSF
ncbi:unnamed protein product, partial [Adineta steineri]